MGTDQPRVVADDPFEGTCNVCGLDQVFARNHHSLREGYECPRCRASLRYRGQADLILRHYATGGATTIQELVDEPGFGHLDIWEPGRLGPFRAPFGQLPRYVTSELITDVPRGEVQDGVRCEDLMALTFADASFDLIVTSDIFEHVRKPLVGFAEIHRVLRAGGRHIFSIPVQWPLRATTVERVDTSGDEDVHILEPQHHCGCIVYNDFGRDLVEHLVDIGFSTDIERYEAPSELASRLLTFCSTKSG